MSNYKKQRLRLQRNRVRQFEREHPELFSDAESDSEKNQIVRISAISVFQNLKILRIDKSVYSNLRWISLQKKINLKKIMFSEYSKTDFSNFENALSLKNELCGFKKRSLNGRACVFTLRWAHAPAQSTCVKFFKIWLASFEQALNFRNLQPRENFGFESETKIFEDKWRLGPIGPSLAPPG